MFGEIVRELLTYFQHRCSKCNTKIEKNSDHYESYTSFNLLCIDCGSKEFENNIDDNHNNSHNAAE